MAFLVPEFEVYSNILLRDVIWPHMAESRAQLSFYDICVVSLCGHRFRGEAVGDEVIHHARKCSGALRKNLPQLPV